MSTSAEAANPSDPPVTEGQNRRIRPRARIGVFLLIGAILVVAGLNLPPAKVLLFWGLLMILRSLWMLVGGSRPGSSWSTDPRVPAASLIPFIVIGLVVAVLDVMSGEIVFAILSVIVTVSIAFWARHYLIGEMVCSNGVWHDREPWLDPGVTDARKAEWVAQRQSGRNLRA